MTYVIGGACVEVMEKDCVSECPVDCIYQGARSLYINPDPEHQHLADNAAFFHETLSGRDRLLGSPVGAAGIGPLGVDTPLVAALPQRITYPIRSGRWTPLVVTSGPAEAGIDGGQ